MSCVVWNLRIYLLIMRGMLCSPISVCLRRTWLRRRERSRFVVLRSICRRRCWLRIAIMGKSVIGGRLVVLFMKCWLGIHPFIALTENKCLRTFDIDKLSFMTSIRWRLEIWSHGSWLRSRNIVSAILRRSWSTSSTLGSIGTNLWREQHRLLTSRLLNTPPIQVTSTSSRHQSLSSVLQRMAG